MQVNIGIDQTFRGVVDLITLKAYQFQDEQGEIYEEIDMPEDLQDLVEEKREELI